MKRILLLMWKCVYFSCKLLYLKVRTACVEKRNKMSWFKKNSVWKPKLLYRKDDTFYCCGCGKDLYILTTDIYYGDEMRASQIKGIDCEDPKEGDLAKCPFCGEWII